jgi:hypothetical protein
MSHDTREGRNTAGLSRSGPGTAADEVVGTWRLKRWETQTAEGRVDYPLGLAPTGYLCYTPDGYVFVAMMRPDRPHFRVSDLLGGSPEERAQAASSVVTYCGRYEVRDKRVIHHIEVSLFPNWVGTTQERFVDVTDDLLTITTAPLEIGGLTASRLTWERATQQGHNPGS